MVGAAARGFALGVAWGVAVRVWMPLISTEPEFSREGTAGSSRSQGWPDWVWA